MVVIGDIAILKCLISLDLVDEYLIYLIPAMRALINRSKAVERTM